MNHWIIQRKKFQLISYGSFFLHKFFASNFYLQNVFAIILPGSHDF